MVLEISYESGKDVATGCGIQIESQPAGADLEIDLVAGMQIYSANNVSEQPLSHRYAVQSIRLATVEKGAKEFF